MATRDARTQIGADAKLAWFARRWFPEAVFRRTIARATLG